MSASGSDTPAGGEGSSSFRIADASGSGSGSPDGSCPPASAGAGRGLGAGVGSAGGSGGGGTAGMLAALGGSTDSSDSTGGSASNSYPVGRRTTSSVGGSSGSGSGWVGSTIAVGGGVGSRVNFRFFGGSGTSAADVSGSQLGAPTADLGEDGGAGGGGTGRGVAANSRDLGFSSGGSSASGIGARRGSSPDDSILARASLASIRRVSTSSSIDASPGGTGGREGGSSRLRSAASGAGTVMDTGITSTTLASSVPRLRSTSSSRRSTPTERSSRAPWRTSKIRCSFTGSEMPSVQSISTSPWPNRVPRWAMGVISSGRTRCAPTARVTACRFREPVAVAST